MPGAPVSQDGRVGAAIDLGVRAGLGVLPEEWAGLREVFETVAHSGILAALTALGVDTSAHVRAPAVEVHVHDTEAR